MYVCVCVCMYVIMYVCMYVCMYVHVCMHFCLYVNTSRNVSIIFIWRKLFLSFPIEEDMQWRSTRKGFLRLQGSYCDSGTYQMNLIHVHTYIHTQAAFHMGPSWAQLGPNLAQPGPNWGPYGMLLEYVCTYVHV